MTKNNFLKEDNMKISNLKRLLCLLLAAAAVGVMPSCADNSADDELDTEISADAVPESETEKPYLDDLPLEMDFGGQEIRFATAIENVSIEVTEEDDTGDVVVDAYWRRNEALEKRMNVDILLANQAGMNELTKVATQFITAGSDDYDFLCGHTRFSIGIASKGYMMNLTEHGFDQYIDMSKPYWSDLYISNCNYKDYTYWLAGDMSTNFIGFIYAMYANAVKWNDYYAGESLYDIVLEGKWTLDELNNRIMGKYQDTNGNGQYDDEDFYGMLMQRGHILNAMFFGAGVNYTNADEEGNISIALNSEQTINIFTKIHETLYKGDSVHMRENADYDTPATLMFAMDQSLFYGNTLNYTQNSAIRDMESDFYVIPFPKYDDSQENYRVNQYDGVPIYGVPTTVPLDRIECLGSTLEAMCSMTSDMVIPVYYDLALKNKYSRDPQTAQMIDLIHDSITAEFAYCWGDSCGGMIDIFYQNIQNENIASAFKRSEKMWNKLLDKLTGELSGE